MGDRIKEIRRHLSPEETDEAISDAQQADEARLVRRLNCIKNLYADETLAEAAWRVGVDESAVSRWSDDWNEDTAEVQCLIEQAFDVSYYCRQVYA